MTEIDGLRVSLEKTIFDFNLFSLTLKDAKRKSRDQSKATGGWAFDLFDFIY